MQLRGPLVGPDRWCSHTLLKGTVRDTLASYGSALGSVPPPYSESEDISSTAVVSGLEMISTITGGPSRLVVGATLGNLRGPVVDEGYFRIFQRNGLAPPFRRPHGHGYFGG
jgi:hypothetical protein